jgi:hypothetical protein
VKNFYTSVLLLIILLLSHHSNFAQCPYGFPPGTTAYDTTIATPAGINTMYVKFPQADPYEGMVTCLRLCITITGVVDSVSVENNSASPQTANVYYIRTDQITGPGLSAPLTNSINHTYGPYALGATNGILGSGPDFVAISKDTVLNAVTICTTINNPDSLFQFYGHDSVTYLYNITAFTNVTCTGGNYNSTVATSALVRFRFEYCTCPGYILPLNMTDFRVNKLSASKARLSWHDEEYNEVPYYYEPEVSRDGIHFTGLGKLQPQNTRPDNRMSFDYASYRQSGTFLFRIKQVYANGFVRFSNIRQVELENSDKPEFIIYPNPSNGIVGIKFANNEGGKFRLELYNTQGQLTMAKEIVVTGSSVHQIVTLQKGTLWLRVVDVTSQLSCVNQLFIK